MAIEKMAWHEIVSETMKLLQSLNDQEKEIAVAAIAAGCGMTAKKNATTTNRGFKPYPKRKY